MGIALPFVGYVKARGRATVRHDPESKTNEKHIKSIRTFFEAMRAADPEWFSKFMRGAQAVQWSSCFTEILLETDDVRRPKLKNYLKRSGDSTLVISVWEDLFEVKNDVVDDLVKRCLKKWSPILRIDQPDVALTRGLVHQSGSDLPHRIMRNQANVQEAIVAKVRPLSPLTSA